MITTRTAVLFSLLAIASGTAVYFFTRRSSPHSRDDNAENLYSTIAAKLADELKLSHEAVLTVLRNSAQEPQRTDLTDSLKLYRQDGNAERLYRTIAEKLGQELRMPPEAILTALTIPGPNEQKRTPAGALKIECTFRKLSPSVTTISVTALSMSDGTVKKTSLSKEIGWDELPRDVRSEFIRNGGQELHYVLGETNAGIEP